MTQRHHASFPQGQVSGDPFLTDLGPDTEGGAINPPSSIRTISTLISNSVTLGQHYGGHLTITAAGKIDPKAVGAVGMIDPATLSGADIVNAGRIYGSSGGADLNGGDGVLLAGANARFTNSGTISGGASGRNSLHYTAYNAGTGIADMSDHSSISNSGFISGGNSTNYGAENIGVEIAADASLTNSGTIAGCNSHYGNGTGVLLDAGGANFTNSGVVICNIWGYANYGIGVDLAAAGTRLVNTGTIRADSYSGGIAVEVSAAGTLINQGRIAAYGGGSVAVDISAAGATFNNSGYIGGGSVVRTSSPNGGTGVLATASVTLTNSGGIFGGKALYQYFTVGAPIGGIGVYLAAGGVLRNSGTIAGGMGGAPADDLMGGTGVLLSNGGTVVNSGRITGGAGVGGRENYLWVNLSSGGDGIVLQAGGSIVNSGVIAGGAGYQTDLTGYGYHGGIGVILAAGGKLTNTGTITGGRGAYTNYAPPYATEGNGGNGVDVNGGTVVTSGYIGGGAPGSYGGFSGKAGDAIYFGSQAGTLVVEQGASFGGDIVGHAGANDVLILGAATAGTLAGLGASITGFSRLVVDTGTTWTLVASPDIGAATQTIAGNLIVDGNTTDSGAVTNIGTILAATGTLAFLGAVTNNGVINTGGAVVTCAQAVGGAGTIDVSAGGTLDLLNGAGLGQVVDVFASSSLLELYNPLNFLGTISGFAAHDRIEINQAGGLVETGYNFVNGTLFIMDGPVEEAALHFSGSYDAADFSLRADGYGGIVITYK